MKKIAIIGSTRLAYQLIYYFESTAFGTVVGLFDDFESPGTVKYDRPVLGKTSDIPPLFRQTAFDTVAVGVGYKHRKFRKEVFEFLKKNQVPVATFVHPSAYVEKSAEINEGCIVLVDCTILMNARLHENVYLAPRCFVSHNVNIHAHTFCAPAVNLAGNTEVDECCFLGINTTSVDGIRIGTNVQTAAGSVLTKDAPPNVMVAGVPAVVKKEISFD
ncbi:MAG: acetyltransferase [Planctomycetota bacterium]|jgi:sugar O-acyltransferase (sialic acid O-acetyltransferase NeuD family)